MILWTPIWNSVTRAESGQRIRASLTGGNRSRTESSLRPRSSKNQISTTTHQPASRWLHGVLHSGRGGGHYGTPRFGGRGTHRSQHCMVCEATPSVLSVMMEQAAVGWDALWDRPSSINESLKLRYELPETIVDLAKLLPALVFTIQKKVAAGSFALAATIGSCRPGAHAR